MKPGPFELFCRYYLGLDSQFRSKHHNLNSVAREYSVLPESVKLWLEEYHMSPEICSHVDFSIAKANADATIISLTGRRDEVLAHAKKAFADFQAALQRYDPAKVFDGVDWEDVWGDGKKQGME